MPGFADAFNLLPMYDRTYNEIRKYDQDTLVFYEPVNIIKYRKILRLLKNKSIFEFLSEPKAIS